MQKEKKSCGFIGCRQHDLDCRSRANPHSEQTVHARIHRGKDRWRQISLQPGQGRLSSQAQSRSGKFALRFYTYPSYRTAPRIAVPLHSLGFLMPMSNENRIGSGVRKKPSKRKTERGAGHRRRRRRGGRGRRRWGVRGRRRTRTPSLSRRTRTPGGAKSFVG